MASVKEKIQKLLALAKSPNENEAKAAILKAKELMAKHKLNESDFEDMGNQELKTCRCDSIKWTTDSGEVWVTRLADLICDEYLCTAAWDRRKGTRTHTLCITGLEDDLQVCKTVMEYAVGFVESAIKHLQRKYSKQDPKSIANSYTEGFILGLEILFEEQREEHPEWTLMVVKPEEVTNYVNSLGTHKVKTKKSDFNPLAYALGHNDGSRFNPGGVLGPAS